MAGPLAALEERSWLYALVVMVVVTAAVLTLRISGISPYRPEFEILLVYSPTIILFAAYLLVRSRDRPLAK